MPDPIAAVSAAATPAPAVSTRSPGTLGKDAFLQLLVAQLKYQNPMEPTDSSQFMAQSAQFTMIERLEEIGRQTADLLAAEQASTAASLMGRHIAARVGEVEVTGVVSSVRLGAGGPVLEVGGRTVALADVVAVTQPPTQPTSKE